MIIQKKRCGWLGAAVVLLPLTALLSGCGKAPETVVAENTTLSPEEQQKAAASTQKGVADAAAQKQAEQEYIAKRKAAGTP